jgi:hypothetical protein
MGRPTQVITLGNRKARSIPPCPRRYRAANAGDSPASTFFFEAISGPGDAWVDVRRNSLLEILALLNALPWSSSKGNSLLLTAYRRLSTGIGERAAKAARTHRAASSAACFGSNTGS